LAADKAIIYTGDSCFLVPTASQKTAGTLRAEIAIAHWNGYGEDDYKSVVVFSIKEQSVDFYKVETFDIEYDRFVFYR
jgi:hypothetical protein